MPSYLFPVRILGTFVSLTANANLFTSRNRSLLGNSPRLEESLACDGLCRILDDLRYFSVQNFPFHFRIDDDDDYYYYYYISMLLFGPVCSFLIFLFRLDSDFGEYNWFFFYYYYYYYY